MEILSRRLCPKTGKQQILVYSPKTADDEQNTKMDKLMEDLFQRHGLSTEYADCGDALYQDVDTEWCFVAFCNGECAGQLMQMEKDWLSYRDKARQMGVIHEFKSEYHHLNKRLNRLPNGKFADKEIQRLFEFYSQAFEMAAKYQGNAKEVEWLDADVLGL